MNKYSEHQLSLLSTESVQTHFKYLKSYRTLHFYQLSPSHRVPIERDIANVEFMKYFNLVKKYCTSKHYRIKMNIATGL